MNERPERLFQLVCVSRANENLTYTALESFLDGAIRRNSALGVTGLLVQRDGRFMIVLEGDREKVMEAMGDVIREPQHSRLKVVAERTTVDRLFPLWAMTYQDGDLESAPWSGLVEHLFEVTVRPRTGEEHLFFVITELARQLMEECRPGSTVQQAQLQ